jgi:hypothetical protein
VIITNAKELVADIHDSDRLAPYSTSFRVLRCIIFSGRESAVGQFLPPTFATATEEPASIPDAKAHNRYAFF